MKKEDKSTQKKQQKGNKNRNKKWEKIILKRKIIERKEKKEE